MKFSVDKNWGRLTIGSILAMLILVFLFSTSLSHHRVTTLFFMIDFMMLLALIGRLTVETVLSFKWLPR